MGRYKKLTLLHSNDMHGDFFSEEKGKDVIFTAVVQTKPEVELGAYKGVKVDKVEVVVTDEEVNAINEILSETKNKHILDCCNRASDFNKNDKKSVYINYRKLQTKSLGIYCIFPGLTL